MPLSHKPGKIFFASLVKMKRRHELVSTIRGPVSVEGGATCERSEEQGAEASANKSLHIGGNCELISNFNLLFCIDRVRQSD